MLSNEFILVQLPVYTSVVDLPLASSLLLSNFFPFFSLSISWWSKRTADLLYSFTAEHFFTSVMQQSGWESQLYSLYCFTEKLIYMNIPVHHTEGHRNLKSNVINWDLMIIKNKKVHICMLNSLCQTSCIHAQWLHKLGQKLKAQGGS